MVTHECQSRRFVPHCTKSCAAVVTVAAADGSGPSWTVTSEPGRSTKARSGCVVTRLSARSTTPSPRAQICGVGVEDLLRAPRLSRVHRVGGRLLGVAVRRARDGARSGHLLERAGEMAQDVLDAPPRTRAGRRPLGRGQGAGEGDGPVHLTLQG